MTHPHHMLASARAELAATLTALPGPARLAEARAACEACGGALIAPALPWGPQEHEITLLGIAASGPTERAAIAEWIKAAQRSAEGAAA